MSDDEELPPGGPGMNMEGMEGMGGMGDDMSDDDDADMGEYAAPPPVLPEGVEKEILTEAASENWKKPKNGDEVTVHYVGTLQSDGTEFDSSRSRDKPFVFMLGKGNVIKGWDVGVATMKKGELAKFTLGPDFAYGAEGSEPKIPGDATLVFEIELLSWASKDDLFGDEGVIKTQLKEGSGWKSAKSGEEALISVKAEKEDGTSVLEQVDMEYTLGSETLGALGKACDKALMAMKKGEEVTLTCSKEYSGNDGVTTVSLTLMELYETKDVSLLKDKTVMKKQVKEAEGYDMPKDGSLVTLSVESATDGTTALSGFTAQALKFIAGNGDVCDALEAAVQEMKKGEVAILTVIGSKQAAEDKLGLGKITADKVVFRVELQDFEKEKDTWSLSEEEKVEFGQARKGVAANLFKNGRCAMALGRYKKIVDLFNYTDNFKEENKAKAKEIKKLCELNKAACYLKLGDDTEAHKACQTVLKEDSMNVKALYRRAQADCNLKNHMDCIQTCKRLIDIDGQNRDARALLKKAQVGQKEDDKKSQGLYANMCKALGKGKIPEPYKAPKQKGDEYDDEDMDDDEDVPDVAMGGDAAPPPAGGEATEEKPADAPTEEKPAEAK